MSTFPDYDEEEHVFYRDNTNLMRHIWWSEAGGFKHDTWPIAEDAEPAGDPAAMATRYGGPGTTQQHVFYRDQNGDIRHIICSQRRRAFAHDNWTAEASAPAAAGNPAVMGGGYGREQHVFYRDQNDDIGHIWWSEAGGFKHDNWTNELRKIGVPVPPAVGDPAAIRQSVFYRDGNGVINCIVWDTESQSLSHNVHWNTPSPAASDPATMWS